MNGQDSYSGTAKRLIEKVKTTSARAKSLYGDWSGDRRGASIIIFALSLPVLIGFVGLGVETAFWYLEKRSSVDF